MALLSDTRYTILLHYYTCLHDTRYYCTTIPAYTIHDTRYYLRMMSSEAWHSTARWSGIIPLASFIDDAPISYLHH
jgi:hypothetical protein